MPPKKTSLRDLTAHRDLIVGDQYNLADLARLEELLAQIVVLLKEPQAKVTVDAPDGSHNPVIVLSGSSTLRLSLAEVDRLAVLGQHTTNSLIREQVYLSRFVVDRTYARWDHDYLSLEGIRVDPPLRMTDRNDPGISGAGIRLNDLREALQTHDKNRLVILGQPGSGKTTTLERLALDLARERLRDPLNGKLPVRVDLFEFTSGLDPDQFLNDLWQILGVPLTYGEALNSGQICFLLDGVNQMPIADRTKRISRWSHWANVKLPLGNWAVFTCRTADYVPNLHLPEVHVQSLDTKHMRDFVVLQAGPKADDIWQSFAKRLRSGSDRFEKLAENPFMLSRLVDRALKGKALTDSRAVLMGDLAADLLDRELQQDRQPDSLTADPLGTLNATQTALGRLAFAMQAEGEGTGLTRTLAESVPLAENGQAELTLDELLDFTTDATVLYTAEGQGRESVHAFYHHLLQEYFAAKESLRLFKTKQDLTKYWQVAWEQEKLGGSDLAAGQQLPPPPTTGWEETVIMVAALAGKDAARFIEAVHKDNLPLAGRCLAEADPERDDLRDLADHTRADLLQRQRNPAAHLRARIGAGLALGEVGHPELRPQKFELEGRTVWAVLPPLQPVPAGEFIRGSVRENKQAYSDEYTTERKLTLPAYRIGRYPVTNAEYKFFIEDGGYKNERWWSAEGLKWKAGGPEAHDVAIEQALRIREILKQRNDLESFLTGLGWTPGNIRYWKEVTQQTEDEARQRIRKQFERPFDQPGYWNDATLNSPARPVVGVNWHEAQAYAYWLSAITQQPFELPAEMQWEKAARGPSTLLSVAGDGREYPWGDKFDSTLCNTNESHILTTTPIGLFPNGVSPFGLHEISGNVFEWTADWYQQYPGGDPGDDFGEKFKVVRGGSWNDTGRFARCAVRLRHVPDNFHNNIGFRLLSPVS